ncbi:MAG: glutathione S-transferase [Granulosicoccus sp.]|nr:glutathione S-transferase [Granulosicoccus sp.]
MIQLYTWGTPNGRKVSIALEEMGLEYVVHPIDIGKDDQFTPEFLAISPNNKIPAIRDGSVSLFESGAILMYLARKSGRFLAAEGTSEYWNTMQWLMWQMGGFGPMLGQAHHFLKFNSGVSDYAEQRYHTEAMRLYRVLDTQLARSEHVAGEALTIADIAIWPWASRFDFQRIDLDDFPHVRRWYVQLANRQGFQKGYSQPTAGQVIPLP